jgi:hypothetical protein
MAEMDFGFLFFGLDGRRWWSEWPKMIKDTMAFVRRLYVFTYFSPEGLKYIKPTSKVAQ